MSLFLFLRRPRAHAVGRRPDEIGMNCLWQSSQASSSSPPILNIRSGYASRPRRRPPMRACARRRPPHPIWIVDAPARHQQDIGHLRERARAALGILPVRVGLGIERALAILVIHEALPFPILVGRELHDVAHELLHGGDRRSPWADGSLHPIRTRRRPASRYCPQTPDCRWVDLVPHAASSNVAIRIPFDGRISRTSPFFTAGHLSHGQTRFLRQTALI